MIAREITSKIKELSKKYPVIAITGPRQSSKTTLAQEIFGDYKYHNLENLDILSLAKEDSRGFLESGSGNKIIIDEVQKYPDILSYIQTESDKNQIAGQFVITGSEQFALSESITQSLAGRVANFTLLPFSVNELSPTKFKDDDHYQLMLRGFYPKKYDKSIPPKEYYRDYISTYVERDVRQIKNIGDLSNFQRFLQLVAGRVGQVVNMSSLANDTGCYLQDNSIMDWHIRS